MTEKDLDENPPLIKGRTIIQMEVFGHIFKDTYQFLQGSLAKLSKDFKVDHGKLTSFIADGKTLTNTEICFYKYKRGEEGHLSFWDFMNLQNTNPKYWELYKEYCLYDCISLKEIWLLVLKLHDDLLKSIYEVCPEYKQALQLKCQLNQSCTIGGLTEKIINCVNPDTSKLTCFIKSMRPVLDKEMEGWNCCQETKEKRRRRND